MKIPRAAPTFSEIVSALRQEGGSDPLLKVIASDVGPAPDGRYRHWDTLRRVTPPEGFSTEEWWAAIKIARSHSRREIPLLDKQNRPFSYGLPDPMLELLHEIDANTTGPIATSSSIANPQTRDRYIQSSLIEEAITSSQLEGAATTRDVAKKMLRSGRAPLDPSERMILNNYRAIKLINGLTSRPLAPELVFELHDTITRGTIEGDPQNHHLRSEGDDIGVYDDRDGTRLHTPPPAAEIPDRLRAMCKFSNEHRAGVFLHPVIKAIILHFWLAYDHPFVDGNGRTARALFCWSMLAQGFWVFEFLSISRIIRAAPARYGRSFLYTETDENDLTYFILSQLEIIKRAIDELHVYLERKQKELRRTEQLLRANVSLNHRQLALLGHALRHPGTRYSIESHRISHAVVYETARSDLLSLEDRSLLIRSKVGRSFVFAAPADLESRLNRLS